MKRSLVALSVLLAFGGGMAWSGCAAKPSRGWEPGAETGRHRHPGPTVFVMLDGEVEEVLGDGRTRGLKAGQAFWKPARTDHNVRNASGRSARAVAVHLDPAP